MFNDLKTAIKEAIRTWRKLREKRQRRAEIVTPFD